MKILEIIYNWISALSLDICFGALASLHFASQITNCQLTIIWKFLFFISVWTIYSIDHLLDAKKIGKNSVNLRHLYYYKKYTLLLGTTILTGLFSIGLAWSLLDREMFLVGIIMGVLAFSHLFLSYLKIQYYPKEFFLSFVYTIGIWIFPILYSQNISIQTILCVFCFLSINFQNTIMNSSIEFNLDKKEDEVYILQFFSIQKLTKIQIILYIEIISASLFGWYCENIDLKFVFILFIMSSIQITLFFLRKKLQKTSLSRIAGEGSYLLGFLA